MAATLISATYSMPVIVGPIIQQRTNRLTNVSKNCLRSLPPQPVAPVRRLCRKARAPRLVALDRHIAAAQWDERQVRADPAPDRAVVVEDRDRVGVALTWQKQIAVARVHNEREVAKRLHQ